ncbi:MAG: peptidyl-prolyl cis-trans isomerase [Solirubrobacterales bacterium]|nr:peptidyl-prolyl cis-trans isomerase [Solirubrobacterales bacterium]
MLTNFRRSAVAFGATSLAVAGLAACGGDSIPGNAVVRVGDTAIKKDAYEHWLDVAALSQASQLDPEAAQSGKKPTVTIPEPPDFKACIAEKKKSAPKPAKGQPKQTDTQFETQCKQEYEGLRDQVLQFLISSQWIQGEADDRDVKVTDAEVKKQFETTKKQSFPKEEDFKKFLTSSGMTEADLLFRVRLDTLSNKLREAVVKGKDKVSDAQIKEYYEKNKARFAQPERRDLRIVLTKTKAQAEKAKAQLEGGASFSKVAKKSSIDQASKDQGGVLLAVAKGQQEKALDEAVFAAKKGKLSGPVKTQFGYYVFKVQKITKASQQSLKQSTDTIKQLLASQNQQEALDKFVEEFREKWKGRTECKDDFVTQDCENAPEPEDGATGQPGTDGGQPVDPNQQQQVPVDPSQGGGQQVPVDPSTGQPVDPNGGAAPATP